MIGFARLVEQPAGEGTCFLADRDAVEHAGNFLDPFAFRQRPEGCHCSPTAYFLARSQVVMAVAGHLRKMSDAEHLPLRAKLPQ